MSKARIMPLKEGGFVGKYSVTEGKEPWGFVRVGTSTMRFKNGNLNQEMRSGLLRGKVSDLEALVASTGMSKEVDASIAVIECKESEIPTTVKNEINQAAFNGTEEQREAEILRHVKTAGKGGAVCMKDGERVLRFQVVNDGGIADVFVQHDNEIIGSSSKVAEELPAEVAE